MSKEQIKLMHNLVSFVRNLKSELQALTWYCSQDMLKYSNACVQSVPQKYLCRWSPRAERSPLAQITLSAESASIPKIGMLFALVSFSTKSTDNQHNIYNNSDWLTIKVDFNYSCDVFSCPGSAMPSTWSVTATLEFGHKELPLSLETLQTFDQSDVKTKTKKRV